MSFKLFELGSETDKKKASNILVGTVTNNLDLLTQGKVLVRIPALDQEVWARLAAPGAGKNAGLFYVPRIDDEVILGLNNGNPQDAYILGSLWSTDNSPPASDPVTAITTRFFRTGTGDGVAHEMQFDDLEQSITIKSSTGQKITMAIDKIELTNSAGTVTIGMDTVEQSISIKALNSIELSAVQIKLSGQTVQINGDVMTEIKGGVVMIN
jgi:uncharacterized protein involved in type VI secretion and phage assembly